VNRKPTASSKSPPGVRIVMATRSAGWSGPCARISSGSSVASVSARSLRAPSRIATTRIGVTLRRTSGEVAIAFQGTPVPTHDDPDL
jgi:hypothetical protein